MDQKEFHAEVERLVRQNLKFHAINMNAEKRLGVSLVQYHLLATLRDMPGSSPQQLADAVGMHPSSLTQSLKRLLKKGTILVIDDPRDARRKLLTITRHGQEVLVRAGSGIEQILT